MQNSLCILQGFHARTKKSKKEFFKVGSNITMPLLDKWQRKYYNEGM